MGACCSPVFPDSHWGCSRTGEPCIGAIWCYSPFLNVFAPPGTGIAEGAGNWSDPGTDGLSHFLELLRSGRSLYPDPYRHGVAGMAGTSVVSHRATALLDGNRFPFRVGAGYPLNDCPIHPWLIIPAMGKAEQFRQEIFIAFRSGLCIRGNPSGTPVNKRCPNLRNELDRTHRMGTF